MEILPKLPKESIDLILTDPPYGISNEIVIARGGDKMKFKGKDIKQNFGEWDKFKDIGEFLGWTFKWVDMAVEVIRKGGMFCSYFDKDKINFLSKYLQDKHQFKMKGYYADLKSNPAPQARKVKWMNSWEMIGLWQKQGGKLTYNYQLGQEKDWGIRPVVGSRTKEDGNRFHPTQKPISVMKKFILYWSNEGDIVLDCFLGSGSSAVASKKLGRRFIGIEIEKNYLDKAIERLSQCALI